MTHVHWVISEQVLQSGGTHCPAGWATAIGEGRRHDRVYLAFNSIWLSDACKM